MAVLVQVLVRDRSNKGELTPSGLVHGKPDPMSPNFVCLSFAFLQLMKRSTGDRGTACRIPAMVY